MNRYLWLLGVFVVALIVGTIGALPIAALALEYSLLIVLPLTLGVAAMLAALGGAWAGNMLAPDGERRHLLRVVGITEATAAILSLLLIALVFWLESLGTLSLTTLPVLLVIGLVILAVAATLATWRSRDRNPTPGRDGLLALGLIGLTGFVLVWAQALALLLRLLGI